MDVPSFATAGIKGVWTVARCGDAEFGVLNAFDRNYWVADGFPEPGRTMVANLRWRF